MNFQDQRTSPILRLIAAMHEELSLLYAVLADPDQFEPDPEGSATGREISTDDLVACQAAGAAARHGCMATKRTNWQTCHAIGKAAEGACLTSRLEATEKKDE